MRIDKFLKVSRILKRRTLAQDAAKEGKIFVLGKAVKPSYQVKIGDEIEIKFGSGAVKFRVEKVMETVKKDDAPTLYTVLYEEE
jgi:ribosomal 50S subunit-recycling heat shock protein